MFHYSFQYNLLHPFTDLNLISSYIAIFDIFNHFQRAFSLIDTECQMKCVTKHKTTAAFRFDINQFIKTLFVYLSILI